MDFDGFKIVREIRISSRSHVYLALDDDGRSATPVVIKTPSVDLRNDPAYLERFLLEDWIARRIDSPHVVRACEPTRKRNYLYTVTEFIDGQTLTQWMIDNPKPKLATVRGIVEQIAKGLQAFHRLEMLHQDLRPENVMIDAHRHGEDRRLRLDARRRHRRESRRRCKTSRWARRSTPRRNISWARRERRARICFRSA